MKLKKLLLLSICFLTFSEIKANSEKEIINENTSEEAGKQKLKESISMHLGLVDLYGTIKARYEFDTENIISRFSVRNSRLGLNGRISPIISYGIQFELSSNGEFNILDLNASITPVKNLTFTLGQNSVPFYNSYTVTPNALLFANRPFIGKFFTGTRDIGLKAEYVLNSEGFPISFQAGVYNAGVINNPVWDSCLSYAARIIAGSMKGFRASAKIYRYPLADREDYTLLGGDVRYEASKWKIEAEYLNMRNNYDNSDLSSYYLQSAYYLPINNSKIFKNLIPALRWDHLLSSDYKGSGGKMDTSRITAGLGFAFTGKLNSAIFRIDYEHYLKNNDLHISTPLSPDFNNKVTFELLINF